MTSEEIKRTVKATDILPRYGIKIRNGVCSCFIHGQDKHPSMQVFADGVHCHTCGYHADVIQIVQDIENCDFKTAFRLLGGTYDKHTDKAKNIQNDRFKQAKTRAEKMEIERQDVKKELSICYEILKEVIKQSEVFSDDYTEAAHFIPIIRYLFETTVERKEIDKIYAYRKCREIRRRFTSFQ